MQTTITLGDNVVVAVREEMRDEGKNFKDAVNSLIRRGRYAKRSPQDAEPFTLQGRMLESRAHVSFDFVNRLLEELDAPAYR